MSLDINDVRRAFAEDEFYPLFQPLYDLRTGRLESFEALARWNHARLGSIAPDAFIPIVQKCGFINTLTQKLLEKIFSATPLLPGSLSMSINLSPLQLLDSTLPGQVAAAAQWGGFPLNRLTIEITGSALIDDLPRAQAVAHELRVQQCRLALDDFGTEHSCLHHLPALPFDELKVDRSLVRNIVHSRESRTIVAAIVAMGRKLGLRTVGEGVEYEEQAAILSDLECDLGQGWLFGKPVSASEIPRIVSAPRDAWAVFEPAAA